MKENELYLTEQIITYIGNKRSLLNDINSEIVYIKKKLNLEKIDFLDLFSGSGIVARLFKQHARRIYANDLEEYSRVINACYLTNRTEFNIKRYNALKEYIDNSLKTNLMEGLIAKFYAPKNDDNIIYGERAFYTRENALIIDTLRDSIGKIEEEMKKFFLAPLLYEASVHVNTAGVFKGFYKDVKTGIGRFGGAAENALTRIKGKISLKQPVLSNFECDYNIYKEDSNRLVCHLPTVDIAYIDPPYNQHPYGSNYFMLNAIVKNKVADTISQVSGIPNDWNRSAYNKKNTALVVFEKLISDLKAKYAIISYNSEGFISLEEMLELLQKYGKVKTNKIQYNAYRGSRNLKNRNLYVSEYLFVLEKE